MPIARVISHALEVLGPGMAVRCYAALLRLVASGAVQPDRVIKRRIAPTVAAVALAAMRHDAVEGITVIDDF